LQLLIQGKIEPSPLYTPPVGKFDEDKTALDAPDSRIAPLLVVIHSDIEDGSRPEFITEEKAVKDFFMIAVIICDQPQGKSARNLIGEALADDIHRVDFFTTLAHVEIVVPEIVV
jgi:hypothetical protein